VTQSSHHDVPTLAATDFLMKRQKKVRPQMALSALAYNMTGVMNILRRLARFAVQANLL
jgi:hypothetical protein